MRIEEAKNSRRRLKEDVTNGNYVAISGSISIPDISEEKFDDKSLRDLSNRFNIYSLVVDDALNRVESVGGEIFDNDIDDEELTNSEDWYDFASDTLYNVLSGGNFKFISCEFYEYEPLCYDYVASINLTWGDILDAYNTSNR